MGYDPTGMEDDYEPDPSACADPSMIMTDEQVRELMLSRPSSAYKLGQLEGAAVAFGIIALGEWARDQRMRIAMANTLKNNHETFRRLSPHDTRDPLRPGYNKCGCCFTPEHPLYK